MRAIWDRVQSWKALAAVLLLGVAAAGAAGTIYHHNAWARTEIRVTRQDLVVRHTLSGTVVAPPSTWAAAVVSSGTVITKLFVKVGDPVWKGDPLARIYEPGGEAYYQHAKRALDEARKAYDGVHRRLDAFLGRTRRRLGEARAAERRARPDSRAAAADARMEAQAELAEARAEYGAFLEPWRQRLATATETYKDAYAGLPTDVIRAPMDGVVVGMGVKRPERVGKPAGAAVATIVNRWGLQVKAEVPRGVAGALHPDELVAVSFPGHGGDYTATIERVGVDLTSNPVNGHRKRIAIVNLHQSPDWLMPNMDARVVVVTARARRALTLPVAAIRCSPAGQPVATVERGGLWRTEEVAVKLGPSDGERVQIRAGLREGERVLER